MDTSAGSDPARALIGSARTELARLTQGQRWTSGLSICLLVLFLYAGLPSARVIESDVITGSLESPTSTTTAPTTKTSAPTLPPLVISPPPSLTLPSNSPAHTEPTQPAPPQPAPSPEDPSPEDPSADPCDQLANPMALFACLLESLGLLP